MFEREFGDLAAARRQAGRHNWWQCLIRGRWSDRLLLVASDAYPDGMRVELTASAAEVATRGDVVCEAVRSGGLVVALQVSPSYAPLAPAVWFVETREPGGPAQVMTLLAFTGAGQQAGALLDPEGFAATGVRSQDQLGAVHWNPTTGEVDRIYVAPSWRRHHIATALVAAAATLSVVRGRPRLWGDGQRTQLGEELRNNRSWRARTADLTDLAPPAPSPEPETLPPGDDAGQLAAPPTAADRRRVSQ